MRALRLRSTAKPRAFARSEKRWKNQHSAPASYYRGGTSRGLIFPRTSLPSSESEWAPILLKCLGSPDPYGRQLDGLGGGISSLSKVCVVAKSDRDDADVDYTFASIGVKTSDVDMSGNCGNLSSIIGPYAVDHEILDISKITDDMNGNSTEDGYTTKQATVRIHNINTGKIIHSKFPVLISPTGEAQAEYDGDFSIDGVEGTAAKISLEFKNPAGAKTGKLLPTGNVVDTFHGKEATCIDAANPAIFVRASDFGVKPDLTPDEAEAHPTLLAELEKVRTEASIAMGVGTSPETVPASIPKICLVGPPPEGGGVDVLVRAISVFQPHKAVPITTALAVACAARLENSIVNQCLSNYTAAEQGITIGHASGKLQVSSTFDDMGNVESATVFRTARRLFEGRVYWRPT